MCIVKNKIIGTAIIFVEYEKFSFIYLVHSCSCTNRISPYRNLNKCPVMCISWSRLTILRLMRKTPIYCWFSLYNIQIVITASAGFNYCNEWARSDPSNEDDIYCVDYCESLKAGRKTSTFTLEINCSFAFSLSSAVRRMLPLRDPHLYKLTLNHCVLVNPHFRVFEDENTSQTFIFIIIQMSLIHFQTVVFSNSAFLSLTKPQRTSLLGSHAT